MAKTWILDTDTKGAGAQVVPLEKALEERSEEGKPARRRRTRPASPARPAPPRRPKSPVKTTSTALPPGHVRKKSTGEIGKVQAVDPKAGTATVLWLKQGRSSTVPLRSVSRR